MGLGAQPSWRRRPGLSAAVLSGLAAAALAGPVRGWAEPLVVPGPDGGVARLVVAAPLAVERVVVGRGGLLVVDAPLAVAGDFTVQAGGRVTQTPGLLADGGVRILDLDVAGALTIEAGGAVDLLGTGLPPGTTIEPITRRPIAKNSSAGGSHLALGHGAAPS